MNYLNAYKNGLVKGPQFNRPGLAGIPGLPPTGGMPLDASPRPTPPHMGKAALGYLESEARATPAMLFEMTGIPASFRTTEGVKSLFDADKRPDTAFEWADRIAGLAGSTIETALAAANLAGVAGITNKAGQTIEQYLIKLMKSQRGELGPRSGKFSQMGKGAKPEIRSMTGQAYDIADSGKYTPAQLRAKHKFYTDKSDSLRANEQWEEAMEMANEGQKWREAAERMEGAPQHFKKISTTKEIIKTGKKFLDQEIENLSSTGKAGKFKQLSRGSKPVRTV